MLCKRISISILSVFLAAFSFSQEEIDLTFKKPKSKSNEKIDIYASAHLNFSTIWGSDAIDYRDALDSVRQLTGIDVYKVALLPGAQVALTPSLKLSEKFNFNFGLKYTHFGWRNLAKDELNSANFFRYRLKHNFHYIGIPLGFSFKIGETFRISLNHSALILVSNKVRLKDVIVRNNQREVTKESYDFEDLYDVPLSKYLSTFNISFQIELTKYLFFNVGSNISTNLIKNDSNFKFANVQTGIILKLSK